MSTEYRPPLNESASPRMTITNENEISLKELILKLSEWWKYLLSKWLIIAASGIIGGLLGFTYAFITKPIYIAELSFALEDEKANGIGGALGVASQFGFDLGVSGGGGVFSGDNLLEFMKSRSMIEKALLTTIKVKSKEQTLAELYIGFNKLRNSWASKPELKNVQFLPHADRLTFSLMQDSVLGTIYNSIIKNNLSVSKIDKKLSIIAVRVSSKNELFSKYFAEILTNEVSDFYVDTKTRKSVQNLTILQHQTDSVRRALNLAITGVATSVDANPNANPARQILRAPSQRRQVDVQANQAILTELVKNLEISKVALRKETPLIQIIDKPILPLKKEKFGKLKGMILGSLLTGILVIFYLLAKKVIRDVM